MWSLLACCLQCIWGLIEYITKFATVRAAITGEAFFTAGRNVTQLLTRNFLKAYGAGWPDPTPFIPLFIRALSAVVLFDITSCVGVLQMALHVLRLPPCSSRKTVSTARMHVVLISTPVATTPARQALAGRFCS